MTINLRHNIINDDTDFSRHIKVIAQPDDIFFNQKVMFDENYESFDSKLAAAQHVDPKKSTHTYLSLNLIPALYKSHINKPNSLNTKKQILNLFKSFNPIKLPQSTLLKLTLTCLSYNDLLLTNFMITWGLVNFSKDTFYSHLETLIELARISSCVELSVFIFNLCNDRFENFLPKVVFALENYKKRNHSQSQGQSETLNLQVLNQLLQKNCNQKIIKDIYQNITDLESLLFINDQIRFVKNKQATLTRLLEETGLTSNCQISFINPKSYNKDKSFKFAGFEIEEDKENLYEKARNKSKLRSKSSGQSNHSYQSNYSGDDREIEPAAAAPRRSLQKQASTQSNTSNSFMDDFTIVHIQQDTDDDQQTIPVKNSDGDAISQVLHFRKSRNPFKFFMKKCSIVPEKCRIFTSNALPISVCYYHESSNFYSRVLFGVGRGFFV